MGFDSSALHMAHAHDDTEVYRWRGVRGGSQRQGREPIADLAAWTEARFDAGWSALTVCAGDGPVPPPAVGAAGVVAAIDRHPDTGRRRWWASAQWFAAGGEVPADELDGYNPLRRGWL